MRVVHYCAGACGGMHACTAAEAIEIYELEEKIERGRTRVTYVETEEDNTSLNARTLHLRAGYARGC